MTEREEAQAKFSQLCHDAGLINYQIYRLQGDLEDLRVKMRNAALDYERIKDKETKEEATNDQGVTQ